MKVLYVGTDAQVCGASFSMVRLIEELDSRGVEVIPVVHRGNTDNLLTQKGRTHYIVNAWSWIVSNSYSRVKKTIVMLSKKALNIPCYFQYKAIINREKPDIVHLNALTSYSAAKAAIDSGIPIVWHIREMIEEDLNSSFWNQREAHSLMKKADCFIAISRCVEEKYKQVVGADRIRCIYNGVDVDRFLREDHTAFSNKSVVITMAGRINKSKGQLSSLQELIPVLQANPNLILQFAGLGNDSEIQAIKDCRDRAGISEERVKLLGFVEDMDRLWGETDIALVYSKFEAFGRVTIEAKMGGALVVGYNSGGTTELIENGVDGYLFGNGYKSLRETVELILMNPRQSTTVAVQGREKAKTVFTSENNAIQIERLYKEILDK